MEIYEIFDAVATASNKEKKMKVLLDNDCVALRDIIKINFDDELSIHVSKKVPWVPNMEPTQSLKAITKFLLPLSTGTVDSVRADTSFKAMLEQVHPMDAQILYDAVKGRLKVKGLTSNLVKNVWGEKFVT